MKSYVHSDIIQLLISPYTVARQEKATLIATPSVPPEGERGHYHPCGRDFDVWPPLGSALLSHYFNNPHSIGTDVRVMRRIPMRLRSPTQSIEIFEPTTGWGLQVEYRPKFVVWFIANLLLFVTISHVASLFRRSSWMDVSYSIAFSCCATFVLAMMYHNGNVTPTRRS